MRRFALLLAVMAAAWMIGPARSQDEANSRPDDQNAGAAEKVAEPADKIKKLQKERIATLRECADVAAKSYSKGRVEAKEACEPRLLLLKAEVEGAEREADRMMLFQSAIDDLNKFEEIAKEWSKGARGAAYWPVLVIRARRLGVQIELERAKARKVQEAQ